MPTDALLTSAHAPGCATKKRIKLRPDFTDTLGRFGLSIRAVADAAKMDPASIHHMLNPDPNLSRKGGMYPRTAWRLARALSALTDLDEEAAYERIITVVEE